MASVLNSEGHESDQEMIIDHKLKRLEFLNKRKFYFFYATRHPFSNWHPSTFVDPADGKVFNCSEQYMMYKKALTFGDTEVAEQIMKEGHPREQKEWGRKVKNFDPAKWSAVAKQIVYDGCYLKFKQNPEMLRLLLSTKGTLLVEAAKNDPVWGIGMAEDEAGINDPRNWKGQNWLGEVLTDLREDFLSNKVK